jgi:ferredoxin
VIGLTDHPRLIAYLALVIFAMTFIWALIFPGKTFCRYGCPVGAICGIYGLFAPLELRNRDKSTCQKCRTRDCIRGNQYGIACPVFENPATMDTNLYCILCTECIRTCPNNNISLNIRLPAKELSQSKSVNVSESVLIIIVIAFSIFGAINISGFHQTILALAGRLPEIISILLMMAILVGGISVVFYFLSLICRIPIYGIANAFLPLSIFNHLSNTLKLLNLRFEEGFSLISDPLGLSWNLFGTAGHLSKPFLTTQTLLIIVGPLILIGLLYSLYVGCSLLAIRYRLFAIGYSLLVFIPMLLICWFNWYLISQ